MTLFFSVILFIALLFFLLRGPYLSNSIKRVIQPVIGRAVGERIIIDKAVINLFPFYLQTKGFKVFDEEGNRLLWVTKMRAYIDLLGLLSREIRIRRLTAKEPNLSADSKVIKKIIASTEKYTNKGSGKRYSVRLKHLSITDGRFTLTDAEKHRSASGDGLYVEMSVKKAVNAGLSLKKGALNLPGLPELSGAFEGKVAAEGGKIEIQEAKIYSSDSTVEASGEIYPSSAGGVERGSISGKARISATTICDIFGLQQRKEGELSFSGSVDLVPAQRQKGILKGRAVKVNLKTEGSFYLETLMELLEVDEGIAGHISLDGKIHGIHPKLIGEGIVQAEDVRLDTLPLDDIRGEIAYKNKKFSLKNFVAHAYRGELRGNAFLLIPNKKYSVDASMVDIDSPQFFKFISLELPFPEGKVNGAFRLDKTPGRKMELVAESTYTNTSKNIHNRLRDRVRSFNADIDMRDGILIFNKSVLSTSVSDLFIDGNIDLNSKELSLNLEMESMDAKDITAPHFSGMTGPVKFTGRAGGSALNPEISGSIEAGPGTVNGEGFTRVSADVTYNPDILSVNILRAVQEKAIYEVEGSIAFRKSKGLFSFEDPYYRARAIIKGGDVKSLINALYKEMALTGSVSGELFFEGDTNRFKGGGTIKLTDGAAFDEPFDLAAIEAALSPDHINFSSVEIYKNASRLSAKGSLYFDARFNAVVSSDTINLRDLSFFNNYPFDANFSLNMKGSGTFDNPDVEFSANVLKSYFGEASIGTGEVNGKLKDKRLSVKGDFLGGKAAVDARAHFSGALPWDVTMEFKEARYDFLLAGSLENAPRDVSASLEGTVRLWGEREKFSMNSRFNSLSFGLYGYNFKNTEEILLELAEDVFKVNSFSIRGGNGYITASGTAEIGRNYDINLDGKINLTPLKVVSKNVESLTGSGSLVIAISGPWESPEFRGKINIKDGTMTLAGFPYTIGPVNGDIFFDEDRVVFDSINADFASGTVTVSGIGRLEELSLKRLSLSSTMEGVKFRPADGVDIAFNGKFFFERSPKKQNLIGDINITKARYSKRVEWKSWLFQLGRVKEITVKRPSFLDKTALNVYVTGKNNLLIDNNIARTPVEIDLNIRGTFAEYGLIGRVKAEGGKIFFRGNEFDIIEGNVDFVESNWIAPVFHIEAETFTKGYRVRLNLDGPADRFALSLFSDPPLNEINILTLLTSGRIVKGSEGLESGIGAGEATAFLTGGLQDVLEERFKYITGFERFEIDPHTTATGAISSKVTIGKRMLGEKLLVTYSTSVGTTDEHILKLQYDLSKNFSLVGIRDEIGSVGADIKYRFEFR